jgi:hypothetical protein
MGLSEGLGSGLKGEREGSLGVVGVDLQQLLHRRKIDIEFLMGD